MRNFKKVFRIKRECFLSLKRLSLALLPSEIDTLDTTAYVVIDVLRASTTIVTLFERGLSDLLVVNNLSQAVELSNEESRILFGEVGGTPPDGFDYGNSPSEISKLNLKNKKATLFTTNGTKTLCLAAQKGITAVGALSNIDAIALWVGSYESVSIICSGELSGRRFALEDFAVAARFVHKIINMYASIELDDAARLASEIGNYEGWIASSLTNDHTPSSRLITSAKHGQELIELGFAADLQFCASENISEMVPCVVSSEKNWSLVKS